MFSLTETKSAIVTLFFGIIVLLFLLFPPESFLPGFLLLFIPDYLQSTSLLNYFQLHLSFFMSLIIPVLLIVIILYLWRKR